MAENINQMSCSVYFLKARGSEFLSCLVPRYPFPGVIFPVCISTPLCYGVVLEAMFGTFA